MKKEIIQGSFGVLLVSAAAFAADSAPAAFPVWDFEQGIVNEWGGHYNVYQREPSWARTYLDPAGSRAKKGHSLRVTVHRGAGGFCGVWIDLAGASSSSKRSHDASSYRYLSFRIRGQRGGEDFELSLADDMSGEDDEPQTVRPVSAYLPGGVTTQWREVFIPLAEFQGVDLSRLARLTLHFTGPGDYRFFVDDFALRRGKSSASGPPGGAAKPAPGGSASEQHRAMWVWKTLELFDPERKQEIDRLFAFCSENRIREIYLSLEFDEKETEGGVTYEIRLAESYKGFLQRAHQRGFTVQGLAGTPEWALSEYHREALAAVEAVVAFNRAAPDGSRFDGVHFDVEPYLLLVYADPAFRPLVLEQFLELVSRCAERVRTETNLRFGCDVPSWFYPADGPEGREVLVKFRGGEKSVGEHLTGMLDAVTIMNYINQADGAGGIIARGIPALKDASAQGKKVVVGLETFLEPDRPVHFVCKLPAQGFGERLADFSLRGRLDFEGFRLAVLFDETDFHVGLTEAVDMPDSRRPEFGDALLRLARKVSEGTGPERDPVSSSFDAARAVLARNPDWRGFETFEITDPESHRAYQGFRAIRRMSPRITFHGLGREVFEEETRSSEEWLGPYPGFGGLAIHFYDSFRELLEGK